MAKSDNANLNRSLFDSKRLALILDLDQTLIDTIALSSPDFASRLIDESHSNEFLTFTVAPDTYVVRCRPHLQRFLETLSPHFTMYVSTLSRRSYAEAILRFIDPSSVYFANRLMCRDDEASPKNDRKSIVGFFPDDGTMVVIVDDCPSVWMADWRDGGLLQIEGFHYFKRLPHQNPSVVENAVEDAALVRMSEVLLAIHSDYFTHDFGYHVVLSLTDIRMRVLNGCYLYFADIWPADQLGVRDDIIRRAEQFGGTVLVNFMPYCTHVVTMSMKSAQIEVALQYEGIWLVSWSWFDLSCLWYKRLDEKEPRFRVDSTAPAATVGALRRADPPSEAELNSTDIDNACETFSDSSPESREGAAGEEEDDSTSSVDLTFLDDPDK
jgi:RNA polymerase II subunit A-like phosphatase